MGYFGNLLSKLQPTPCNYLEHSSVTATWPVYYKTLVYMLACFLVFTAFLDEFMRRTVIIDDVLATFVEVIFRVIFSFDSDSHRGG